MRTSSMLTRQISFGARRLWRAQTNPYAAQNLARARTTDPHLRAPIDDRPNAKPQSPSLRPQAFFPRKRPSVGDNVEAGDLSDVVFAAYAGQGGGLDV